MNPKLIYLTLLLISFKGYSQCGTVTDYDGNLYNTVAISTQCWMKENLKTTHYRDGSTVNEIEADTAWKNNASGTSPNPAWCNVYGNAANDATYGKLYNWYAATDSRGLCPVGWHLPSDSEWIILADYLGGETTAGAHMKAVTQLWEPPNVGADNSSGFTALPAGNRISVGYCGGFRSAAIFWSSTTVPINNAAFSIPLFYTDSTAYCSASDNKSNASSVRCLSNTLLNGLPDIGDKTNKAIQIFPNPSFGNFTIKITAEQDKNCEFEIFDIVGRRVANFNYPQHLGVNQFNYSITTKGVYFIRMIGNNSSNVTRLVIE